MLPAVVWVLRTGRGLAFGHSICGDSSHNTLLYNPFATGKFHIHQPIDGALTGFSPLQVALNFNDFASWEVAPPANQHPA